MALTKEQLAQLGLNEGASAEEIEKATIDFMTKSATENAKLKSSFDKTSSELANLKKEKQAKLSEDEKEQERVAQLEKDYAEMKATIAKSNARDAFIGAGYDGDTAMKLAEAQLSGDTKSMTEIMKKHNEKVVADAKAEALKGTPKAKGGNPNEDTTKYTKENFKQGKITYEELCELQASNPTLYDEITSDK